MKRHRIRNSILKALTCYLGTLMVAGMVSPATAQQSGGQAGKGPEVGSTAPDFELKDQHGKRQQLSDLWKTDYVALVFHRSADW